MDLARCFARQRGRGAALDLVVGELGKGEENADVESEKKERCIGRFPTDGADGRVWNRVCVVNCELEKAILR